MAEPISVNQLKAYRQAVETRGVVGAVEVYAELYSQGYTYAGWALPLVTQLAGKRIINGRMNSSNRGR